MAQESKSSPPTATGPKPAFDPYYHWLGIPPREQPANHYRLLGLSMYEENHEVIAFAAERQMTHVRMFQAGPHSAASQKLLNELAAAELCLTTPARKSIYDKELWAALKLPTPTVITPAAEQPATTAVTPRPSPVNGNSSATRRAWVADILPPAAIVPVAGTKSDASPAPSVNLGKQFKIGLIATCVIASTVLVWLTIQWLNRGNSPDKLPPGQVAQETPGDQRLPAQVDPPPPTSDPGTGKIPAPFLVPSEGGPSTTTTDHSTPVEPPRTPEKTPAITGTDTNDKPPLKSIAGSKIETTPEVSPSREPKAEIPKPTNVATTKPDEPAIPARLSPPTSLDQRRARELLEQVWAGQIQAAATPAAKNALAEQLLKKMDELNAAPTERFVMLDQAQELAVAAGNLKLALSIVNLQTREFNVDSLAARAEAMQSIQGKVTLPESSREFVAAALDLSDEAFDAKNYSLAERMSDLSLATARKINNAELIKTLVSRKDLIQESLQKVQRIADARQTLAAQPTDAAANRLLGEYLCLEENDWEQGLPHLTQSGDADLAELACADLSKPTVVDDQLELAERWWSCRFGASADFTSPYRQRAMIWYRAALASLSGLKKAKVEQRIQELQRLGTATEPPLASGTFNAQAAHELQRRWAKTIKSTPTKANSLNMTLVLVPAGEFKMGVVPQDMQAADDERPAHAVRLSRPFYLAAHEVTVEQFTAFVTASGYQTDREQGKGNAIFPGRDQNLESTVRDAERAQEKKLRDQAKGGKGRGAKFVSTWRTPLIPQTNTSPVVYVSWNDAVAFCNWLGKRERAKYRLPTEAEWEFACRAGTATIFSNGDQPEDMFRVGNIADLRARKDFPHWTGTVKSSDGFTYTAPVGHYSPNGFGLLDMHGNAAEWCGDHYLADYYTDSPPENAPGPTTGNERVFRGGGWCDYAVDCRASARGHSAAENHGIYVGFRVVCEP